MSEKKESKLLWFLGYAIPILLMVYVLSIGPVVVFVEDSNGNLHTKHLAQLRSFYAPVVWVMDRNMFCRKLYIKYHKMCSPNY